MNIINDIMNPTDLLEFDEEQFKVQPVTPPTVIMFQQLEGCSDYDKQYGCGNCIVRHLCQALENARQGKVISVKPAVEVDCDGMTCSDCTASDCPMYHLKDCPIIVKHM